MSFEVVTVLSEADKMRFIKSQWNFYKNDPNFVPPLIMDRKEVLSPKKNPFFEHSEMELFMAVRAGEVIGRIAGIINHNHNKTHNDKVGFFGFFECVNEQAVADALFAKAGEYLHSKGMEIARGPENPSMNDEIGLLIDGFDGPPVIMMPYNPPYYEQLIEKAGFTKAKDVYAFKLEYENYASDKLKRMQSIVRERNKITIRQVDFKNKQQFARDVDDLKKIYNEAWVPNWGFVKWTEAEFDKIAESLKLIARPELSLIAEVGGKVAGMAIALPDINQCLIHNKKGGIIGGIWHLMTKKNKINSMRVIALGVKPEYQKTGVDAAMYYEIAENGMTKGITGGEASWILEDNMMMVRQFEGTMKGHVYRTYRLYDKNI